MDINTARVITILDASSGRFTENEPQGKTIKIDEARIPYPRDHKGRITVNHENVVLKESPGGLDTANFPSLLRPGLQFDAWTSYSEVPTTYPSWCRVVDSNKQQEEYLKDSPVGLLPIVAEGQAYPEAVTDVDSGVIIKNYKRGMIMSVTIEMQMFDQVGKVRELAEILGRSARLGEEQAAMDVLTTTGNYTRNSTTGDNDEGANTQTLTFSPAALVTAFNILRTMKDRKTGVYLNVMPDTLIVTPKLWWATRQLIGSPEVMRTGDSGSAAETYGTGTTNTFFNAVRNIIVSPQFGSTFGWALMEARRAITFQRVAPLQILQETPTGGARFERDVIRYRVSNWFGVGMRDDRFAFLSDSTTAPAIN